MEYEYFKSLCILVLTIVGVSFIVVLLKDIFTINEQLKKIKKYRN